jgi:Flp pilus assembly pilin Flp
MTDTHAGMATPPRSAGRRREALLRRLGGDRRGASAIEFALIGSIFAVLLLNVVDFSILIWSQMQVDHAAAVGAQAAYKVCLTDPANCRTNWTGPVTTAANSTSLGSAALSVVNERYFCTIGSTLQPPDGLAPPPPPLPPDCRAQGDPNTKPASYVTVNVNYSFTPLFSGLSFLAQQQTLQGIGMQSLQ